MVAFGMVVAVVLLIAGMMIVERESIKRDDALAKRLTHIENQFVNFEREFKSYTGTRAAYDTQVQNQIAAMKVADLRKEVEILVVRQRTLETKIAQTTRTVHCNLNIVEHKAAPRRKEARA